MRHYFPDITKVNDELGGVIALGGDLTKDRLLSAYKLGIFPWYEEGQPVIWYNPNPRMIITEKHLKVSRSLKKILNNNCFTIKENKCFASVIKECASIKRKNQTGTWITSQMQKAYIELHNLRYARSVEVYMQDELVAGLYGVTIGKVFFGESMFTRVDNASKVAFVHLVKNTPYKLFDCQIKSKHLESLGAISISRTDFMAKLKKLIK